MGEGYFFASGQCTMIMDYALLYDTIIYNKIFRAV